MKLTLPIGFALIAYILIIPQFNLIIDTRFLFFMILTVIAGIFFIYYCWIRDLIINLDKEEVELIVTNKLKLFVSKSTALLLALNIAALSATMAYEMSTKIDWVIHLGGVPYSMDKLLSLSIILMFFVTLEETVEVYLKSSKGIRLKKKKR